MKKLYILVPALMLTALLLTWCDKDQDVNVDTIAVQWELQEQIDLMEEQKEDVSIPSWAMSLNISAPEGMQVDATESYQTTEKVEWFNSIHFVYEGEYDIAIEQAEKIAKASNTPLSEEFKIAQEMIDNIGIENIQMQELMWDMKWALYTNYSLMENPTEQHMIAITVDEDWTLEIDVADRKAMENIANTYTK